MRQRYKDGVGSYADLQTDIRSYLNKVDAVEALELSILSGLSDFLEIIGKEDEFKNFVKN